MSDDSFSVKCGGEGASLPKWGGGGLSLAMNSSEPNRMLAINAISGAPFNAADVGCGDADIDHRNHHRNRNFESEFASFLATVKWFRLRRVARDVVSRSMVGGGRKGLRWRRAFANDIGCPGGYAVDGLDSKPSIPLLGASMARLKETVIDFVGIGHKRRDGLTLLAYCCAKVVSLKLVLYDALGSAFRGQ